MTDTNRVLSHAAFRNHLSQVKGTIQREGWDWYPYHSIENAPRIASLLEQAGVAFEELIRGGPVLDIGCGDGEMAFFLEDLGAEVDALDYAPTNYNGLRGARALHSVLGSHVQLHEQDIDARFTPPRTHYSVAFALGLLYHLKNPFGFLETLQKHVDYCFLSTRIARFFPGFSDPADASAIAYLVDSNECNEDVTNYWIFSDAGLRRILSRTGWEIRALQLSSQMSDSDPISPDRDQRAFCLLQANRARAWLGVTLTRGWHELESGQFRWTEKTFGLRALRCGSLRIRLFLPDALLPAGKSIVLTASASGKEIGRQEFTHPGAYNVAIRIDKPGEVIFKTNFALGPDQNDSREKGLIVGSAEIWQESDTSQED